MTKSHSAKTVTYWTFLVFLNVRVETASHGIQSNRWETLRPTEEEMEGLIVQEQAVWSNEWLWWGL